MKIFLFLILFLISINSTFAFEDCLIITDGKLSDIKIENNKIIDVFPLITIMNDKNTLVIHPLMSGKTRFCVLKNGKNLTVFSVEVTPDKTLIDEAEGFDILTIDEPPEIFEYELDLPPMSKIKN